MGGDARRKLRRNFGRLLLIGAGTLVLADYGRELIAVDRCLDAGSPGRRQQRSGAVSLHFDVSVQQPTALATDRSKPPRRSGTLNMLLKE